MVLTTMARLAGYAMIGFMALAAAAVAQQPQNPAEEINGMFGYVNKQVLDIHKDFPADKYDFKLKPEMRTFGAVMVHIASGNVYAAKAGRGEKSEVGRVRREELQRQGCDCGVIGEVDRGCDGDLEGPAGGQFSQIGGAVAFGDRAFGRALWAAGGLLPGQRDGASGVAAAKEIGGRSSIFRSFWAPNGIYGG